MSAIDAVAEGKKGVGTENDAAEFRQPVASFLLGKKSSRFRLEELPYKSDHR